MLLFMFINFIYGYYKLMVNPCDAENVINILMEYEINYWNLKRNKNKELNFNIMRKDLILLKSLLDKSGYKVYIIYEKGLPYIMHKYRKRVGIPVGALVFTIILWMSTLFIWDIEIKTSNADSQQVIENLNSLGCGIGTFIPSVDFDELCNKYILEYNDAAWITVNLRGTVANVELRERIPVPEITDTDSGKSNMVAKFDGQIDRCEIYSGTAVVKAGDIVRKGDLLISGVVDTRNQGYTVSRASGKVFAKVIKHLNVNVPLNFEKKVFTGHSKIMKTLNIFGKKLNLYINDEIFIENYDKITSVHRIILFGIIRLPITVTSEILNEYEYIPCRLTEDEAVNIANIKIAKLADSELKSSEILSKTTSSDFIDDSYVIDTEIYCIDDIANEVGF